MRPADRTLTSFASGFSWTAERVAAFSRSIAKLSKLSNRGQRVYNTKVTNRGREEGREWERERRDRRVGASTRTRASIWVPMQVLGAYNIPRASCHFVTAFQWLMSAFESTLGTVRYTVAVQCRGELLWGDLVIHTYAYIHTYVHIQVCMRTYRVCIRHTTSFVEMVEAKIGIRVW